MVRLIYVSRMTEECDMDAIEEILKVSRRNNVARNITGMLCYDPRFFLQCLEGPREAVNELYRDIARDSRHAQVTLLEYQDIRERAFGEWSMAFLRSADLGAQLWPNASARGKWDPFTLSPDQARTLVLGIAESKREQLGDQADNPRSPA